MKAYFIVYFYGGFDESIYLNRVGIRFRKIGWIDEVNHTEPRKPTSDLLETFNIVGFYMVALPHHTCE